VSMRQALARTATSVLLVLVSRGASAQANITVTVQMPVADVFSLTISPLSTPLGTPTWADFTTGYLNVATPVSLTARANRSYMVTISAATPTFSFTPAGAQPNPNKPRSDLQWAHSSGGAYTSIGTGGTVLSGGAATNGASQDVYYRTLWNIAQAPPGNYSLNVSFTISAP
jgi:hypothetical protein